MFWIEFQQNHGRVKITLDDGSVLYATMERADEPTQEGTPINKVFFDSIKAQFEQNTPKGLICMWSGTEVPVGWLLCDGENGTPDLRDRFIVGAGNEYNVGDIGGEKEVTLTLAQIPSHTHGYTKITDLSYKTTRGSGTNKEHSTSTDNTSSSGGGEAHENRPPYYALAYIMKA